MDNESLTTYTKRTWNLAFNLHLYLIKVEANNTDASLDTTSIFNEEIDYIYSRPWLNSTCTWSNYQTSFSASDNEYVNFPPSTFALIHSAQD